MTICFIASLLLLLIFVYESFMGFIIFASYFHSRAQAVYDALKYLD